MSAWLIAIIGVVYAVVAADLLWRGNLGLGIAFLWPTASMRASVAEMVNQVSVTSYRQYLDNELYTHTGDNRGNGLAHDLARDNIFDLFTGFGLDTRLDAFTYQSATYYNVIGMSLGTLRPDDIYLVGAHFDSFDNPGADDNASGVAGVL